MHLVLSNSQPMVFPTHSRALPDKSNLIEINFSPGTH